VDSVSDTPNGDRPAPTPGSVFEAKPLGRTGIDVSPLGLGTGTVGALELSEAQADRIINGALDRGVRVFDTARSYGLAEERLARHLGRRRDEAVLVTKGGYGVEGIPDWTGTAVSLGINRALRTLKTDRIDVFLLHSCAELVLGDDAVLQALVEAKAAGKVRAVGYSGDNHALAVAAEIELFEVFECSLNPADQANRPTIEAIRASGRGVIAKRPLGNAAWGEQRPQAPDQAIYWERYQALGLTKLNLPMDELVLRFSAFAPGINCAVVGCSSLEHLTRCAEIVELGPLPAENVRDLGERFASATQGSWPAVV
jgi:aryl-alcohol dehydrogenase-like predicted oxidoreductase